MTAMDAPNTQKTTAPAPAMNKKGREERDMAQYWWARVTSWPAYSILQLSTMHRNILTRYGQLPVLRLRCCNNSCSSCSCNHNEQHGGGDEAVHHQHQEHQQVVGLEI